MSSKGGGKGRDRRRRNHKHARERTNSQLLIHAEAFLAGVAASLRAFSADLVTPASFEAALNEAEVEEEVYKPAAMRMAESSLATFEIAHHASQARWLALEGRHALQDLYLLSLALRKLDRKDYDRMSRSLVAVAEIWDGMKKTYAGEKTADQEEVFCNIVTKYVPESPLRDRLKFLASPEQGLPPGEVGTLLDLVENEAARYLLRLVGDFFGILAAGNELL